MIKVLITGAEGQLGQSLKNQIDTNRFDVVFTDRAELDITRAEDVFTFFSKHQFDYCINAAAFTRVDDAEQQVEKAYDINANGAKHMAIACNENGSVLIHISTDFVFDGISDSPYTESDIPNPINEYGRTKLQGERFILETMSTYFIIRTSWVYSEYGNNFVKTMVRLSEQNKKIKVVNDQWGSPTYAGDLAKFILFLMESQTQKYGLYNYTNGGVLTWYEFAKAIFEIREKEMDITPIPSSSYPTPASRPPYSKLNTALVNSTFGVTMPHWKESLKTCLSHSPISS